VVRGECRGAVVVALEDVNLKVVRKVEKVDGAFRVNALSERM
jgi:hypothetical protein